jgi:amino acid adenylation domain-containing protein
VTAATFVPGGHHEPLSFAQQRLWFLDQLQPGSFAYNITMGLRAKGKLEVAALERSLGDIVRRHEPLRTVFATVDGQPVQAITPFREFRLRIVDLAHLPTDGREDEARRLMVEEGRLAFDLRSGPLFRARLFRLAPDEHVLQLTMHHIVADGWSFGVLVKDLAVLYHAHVTGGGGELAPLPLRYAEMVRRQRRRLVGAALEAHATYWRTRLSPPPPVLELPADYPRPAIQTFNGAVEPFHVPPIVVDKLRRLSREHGLTLFMTLLAAFDVILHRYTGLTDVAVGTPIANRTEIEAEAMIGLFANTLVLRADLGGDPTFRELLRRVRDVALGAYAHQDFPFEQVVEMVKPPRDMSHSPLFQAMFILQNTPLETTELAGVRLSYVEIRTGSAKTDLTLEIWEGPGGLGGHLEYNTDLFEADTVRRLGGHLERLLAGIVDNPGQRISRLPLLGAAERRRITVEWNATEAKALGETVPRLFDAQVARAPDAVAASFEGRSLSYRELSVNANRLAHHLRRHGVGPNVLVGVFVDRSLEMLIAVLAVMKAGGAYVPLDPAYPADRLEFMLQDARISVLVTQEALLDRFRIPAEMRVLCLDRDVASIDREPEKGPDGGAGANDLAYVIYTSGSTGRPKGVQIAHRSLANLLAAFRATPGITGRDVLVSVTTLSFDIAGLELFLPLVAGAHLVIASREVAADPVKLTGLMVEAKLTIMQATPATWQMLLEAGWGNAAGLTILCGGAALSADLARRLLGTGASLWNVYGPTETTIWSTMHRVTAPDGSVRIGRPIANTQVYVLDANGEPVPIGVPGELYIGGLGVAEGYLDRPDLTAEKFVADRFSGHPAARLYRTGDIARYRPDGTLEFLGRADHQVKVRGFRIELGEIESVLAQHHAVAEAVVVAREDTPGDRYLAAYIRLAGARLPNASDYRAFLKERLPEYMVPITFTTLEAFPLTPNGKVDRRALPAPEKEGESVPAFDEPRDELERQLVRIWQEVLSVSRVGTRDNFFDLGGHSLLAVQMFARIEEYLWVTLPLATLFQAPTIEGLAAVIRAGTKPVSGRSLVAIQPTGSRPPVFAVPGVGGNVLGYHDLARLLGPDQPFYGLQSRGLDGAEQPLTRVEDIAAGFIREIRVVQPDGPYYLVGACMGGVVAYEMAQQLRRAGQEIGLLALLETWPPVAASIPWFRPTARALAVLQLGTDRLRLYLQRLARLRGRERLRYLLGRMKMFTEIVAQRDLFRGHRSEFYQRVVTQANLRALQQYEARAYPGAAVLFRAEGRHVAPDDDRRLAWRQLSAGGLEIYTVPGDDSGLMLVEPHVQAVAEQLNACFERALRTLAVSGALLIPIPA